MNAARPSRGSARAALAVSVIILLALGGTGFWLVNGNSRGRPTAPEAARFRAVRGPLRITLRQTGTFEAEEALPVRADIRGNSKIVWLIDEGTQVKKGQIVVELDKTDIEKEIEQYTAQVDNAGAKVIVAEADEEITRLDCQSKIRKAEIDLEMAGLEIKKFSEGTKPKEGRDARIKIDQAVVRHSRAAAVDARMPDLLKQGFVTKEEVEQSKLDVETAKNEMEGSRLEYQILTDYSQPMQERKLASDKRQAEETLERYRQEARRREAQTRAAATQARQEFTRFTNLLKDAKTQSDHMTVRAESDGIVVYGSGFRDRWNQEDIKLGTTVHRQLILMRLPNLNTMQIIIQIHEADINRVRADDKDQQAVAVTSETLPGQTFDGYVKKIETIAQSNWFNRNVKWFTTTIALRNQIPGIRPGMTAAVEILTAELSGVLYVPIQSVHTQRGQSYCYVVRAGRSERQRITVGASNNSFVEVKDGLKEGDEVLLVKPDVETQTAPDEGTRPKAPSRRSREGR